MPTPTTTTSAPITPSPVFSISSASSSTQTQSPSNHAGAIAGGTVGGILAIGAICGILLFCVRKKPAANSHFPTPTHPVEGGNTPAMKDNADFEQGVGHQPLRYGFEPSSHEIESGNIQGSY